MTNLERLFVRVNEGYLYQGRRVGFPNDWFRIVIRGRYRRANRDWSSPGFPNASDWEAFNFIRHFIEHKSVQCFFQERLKKINKLRRIKRFALQGNFFGKPYKTPGLDIWLVGREAMFRPEFQFTFKNFRKYRRWGEVLVKDFYRHRGPHNRFYRKAFMPVYSNGAYSTFLRLPWKKPHRLLLPNFLEKGLIWLEIFFFPGEWSMRVLLARFFLFFLYFVIFACICNFFYSILFASPGNSFSLFFEEASRILNDMGPAFSAWIVKYRIKFSKMFFAIRYDILSIIKERKVRQKRTE